jgi:glycosyltransferase involved in cell wall biosynthesis
MKKSLLIVTPRYPYPVIGGDRIRIYYLCKALSQHFEVSLLSLCETREEMASPLPEDGVFSSIERIYYPKWRSWINALLAIPTRSPLQVAYYGSSLLSRRIKALSTQHDGVFLHLVRLGEMTRHLKIPKFLEMTDAISLNYRRVTRLNENKSNLLSYIYRLEEPRLQRYEKSIVNDFDHTFLVSDVDRLYLFEDDPGKLGKTSAITNGVDFDRSQYEFSAAGKDLVFIGNMSTLPNIDAVKYMATEILPRVRKKHPSTSLRVIGRIGPRERSDLMHLKHVHIIGEVDSVADAARGAGAGVCPMRLGAGIQNKLLEYMALGLPAVSTTIGLEGLYAQPGVALEVADDPASFARHLIHILSDRSRAEAMALAARHYVEENHSWQSVTAPMVQIIQERLLEAATP